MTVPPQAEVESAFKMMTIVFAALLSGQLIFLAVILVVHSQGFEFIMEKVDILPYIGIAALLAGFGASASLYRAILKPALSHDDPSVRIVKYSTATLLRLAILEAANLINLVFYLLMADNLFLVLFAFGFIVFVLALPNRDTLNSDVQHSRTTPTG